MDLMSAISQHVKLSSQKSEDPLHKTFIYTMESWVGIGSEHSYFGYNHCILVLWNVAVFTDFQKDHSRAKIE